MSSIQSLIQFVGITLFGVVVIYTWMSEKAQNTKRFVLLIFLSMLCLVAMRFTESGSLETVLAILQIVFLLGGIYVITRSGSAKQQSLN